MAFRTLSRRIMVIQPGKTCMSGLMNAEKSPTASHETMIRCMTSGARENAPMEDSQIEETRRENSNSPASRASSGLGRGGYARRRPTELSVLDIWDPFFSNRSLKQMLDTVDRLFEAPFFSTPTTTTTPPISASLRSPWDVMEDEDAFRLRIDVPGLSKEEVKVTVEDGDLVIKGEHNAEANEDENGWSSRSYGSYHTRLSLPDHVKHDGVTAELKNGVLHIEMPKTKEEPKKNAIDIEVH